MFVSKFLRVIVQALKKSLSRICAEDSHRSFELACNRIFPRKKMYFVFIKKKLSIIAGIRENFIQPFET